MTALILALLLAPPQQGSADAGLAAFREGRYEDAARLLQGAMVAAPSYEGLLSLGLAHGRLGRHAEAAAAFDRALALDAARPEAWVERGGLRFLEKNYAAAASDLRRALALSEDAYTRDLLAASLHLAGRSEEALEVWNALGRPRLRSLEIEGLQHTRDRVARRELTLAEGDVLDVAKLRESRLRLQELGIFDRVSFRSAPQGDGQADLDVIVTEQHGFARSLPELAAVTAGYAARGTAHLRYANLAGTGISLTANYRWQKRRPELSFAVTWPRPLGLPAVLQLRAFDGQQEYVLAGEALRRDAKGLDLGLRRVLGSRTVGELTLRTRDRSLSRARPDAPPGEIVGLEAGIERRLLETHRHRLDGAMRLFGAPAALGSDLRYARSLATLEYRGFLVPPDGVFFERSVLAAKLWWGAGSVGLPVDEMFAPGGSPEMELPLRARRQRDGGALGASPIGRTLLLGNLEWRQRVWGGAFAQWGTVLFCDAGHVGSTAEGPERTLIDVGLGLRVALGGSLWVRADFGHGLADGSNAFFVNFGQVF